MRCLATFVLSALLVQATLQAQTTYTETVLHNFAQILTPNGARPIAPLVRDRAGDLYGTTSAGGAWGQGTVFKVDSAGNESVLHRFTGGADGAWPYAGLVLDDAGNQSLLLDPSGNLTALPRWAALPALAVWSLSSMPATYIASYTASGVRMELRPKRA
jgi:uncharacterized repeat protein (TIGR03803 family)